MALIHDVSICQLHSVPYLRTLELKNPIHCRRVKALVSSHTRIGTVAFQTTCRGSRPKHHRLAESQNSQKLMGLAFTSQREKPLISVPWHYPDPLHTETLTRLPERTSFALVAFKAERRFRGSGRSRSGARPLDTTEPR